MGKVKPDLKEFESVRAWLRKFPDSPKTRTAYSANLQQFLAWAQQSPDEFLALARKNKQQATGKFEDYYNKLIDDGISSKRASTIYSTVRSFLTHNDVSLGKMASGFKGRTEYEIEHDVLTTDEVQLMLDACDSWRDKALIATLAESGQRIGVLSALKVKHVKGLKTSPVIVEVGALFRDVKRDNVNKSRESYRFCVGVNGVKYLKLMLDERKRAGEPLDGESWLFRSYGERGRRRARREKAKEKGKPLNANSIQKIVKEIANKAGLQKIVKTEINKKKHRIHPHSFRTYANNRYTAAGLDYILRNFLLGHKVAYGGAYDKFMPDYIRDEWLAKKADSQIWGIKEVTDEAIRKQTILNMAESLGIKVRIEKAKDLDEQLETIQGEIKKLITHPVKVKKAEQKMIREKDIERYLTKGWHVTLALNNGSGKVIVEKA